MKIELFEPRGSPGPMGKLAIHGDKPLRPVWIPFTVARLFFTFGLFSAAIVAGAMASEPARLEHGAMAGGGFLLYLLAGYFIRPKPGRSTEPGLYIYLVDHPLRWQHDLWYQWNNLLVLLVVVLTPGYVLAQPIAQIFHLIAGQDGEDPPPPDPASEPPAGSGS